MSTPTPDLTPSELSEVTRFGIHEEDQEDEQWPSRTATHSRDHRPVLQRPDLRGGSMNEPKQVPEPSAEDAMSHYTDPADPFWQSHPEPQGEPSDAQVLVEAIEKAISKLHWFPNNGVAEDLRAALRAAGEVDR